MPIRARSRWKAKTGRALVVHEAVRNFGPGAEIAATISEELFGKLKSPVRRLGGAQCLVPFAKVLEDAFLPQPDDIVAAAKAMMGESDTKVPLVLSLSKDHRARATPA